MAKNKEKKALSDNKLEFGINKLLSTLMLAACLVFVIIEGRQAQMNWVIPVVAIAAALVIVLIPWGRAGGVTIYGEPVKGRKGVHFNRIFLRIMFVLTPFVAFWLTNKSLGMGTIDIAKNIITFNGALNIFIIGLVMFISYAIVNHTKAAVVITTALAAVLGVTNYIMLLFRGTPLIATDISSAGTGMDVISNYTMVFDRSIIWIIAVAVIFVSIAVSLRDYKGLATKKRLLFIVVTIAYTGAFAWLFLFSGFVEEKGYSITGYRPDLKYEEYGTVLAFTISATETSIKKPEDYSVGKVKKIAAEYDSDKWDTSAKVSEKKPDLIVIMNESFSDLSVLADFETSADYMPYFDSLKKDVIKGTLHTSVIGGGTAVTEHEFLTGSTSAFLPLHKVIYNDMNEGNYPSLATTLMNQGYDGLVAFHPGQVDSYNRNKAYPAMGFDSFVSVDDMDDPAKIRDYVSDGADYEKLINDYEEYKKSGSKAPYFTFNVTIQNHGGYTLAAGEVPKEIKLTDKKAYDLEAEQYINLIKKSDEALEYLLNYFSEARDPVVIVMFGDHQPRLGDAFYKELESRMPSGLSDLQKEERKYQVPFMIWSNYDLKESGSADVKAGSGDKKDQKSISDAKKANIKKKSGAASVTAVKVAAAQKQGADMSANYFAAYIKDLLGFRMTGYDRFLMDMYKKIPVISDICYIGKDGKYHLYNEKTEYTDALNDYRVIEYNCLKDTKNRLDSFFELKK